MYLLLSATLEETVYKALEKQKQTCDTLLLKVLSKSNGQVLSQFETLLLVTLQDIFCVILMI